MDQPDRMTPMTLSSITFTEFFEACWDIMPLRVAIIIYLGIALVIAVVVFWNLACSTRGGAGEATAHGFLIISSLVGLFWPLYIPSTIRNWNKSSSTPAPASPRAASAPSAAGFDVVIPVSKADDRCSECSKPFDNNRKPIRWRDTHVCAGCRESLRVLE